MIKFQAESKFGIKLPKWIHSFYILEIRGTNIIRILIHSYPENFIFELFLLKPGVNLTNREFIKKYFLSTGYFQESNLLKNKKLFINSKEINSKEIKLLSHEEMILSGLLTKLRKNKRLIFILGYSRNFDQTLYENFLEEII